MNLLGLLSLLGVVVVEFGKSALGVVGEPAKFSKEVHLIFRRTTGPKRGHKEKKGSKKGEKSGQVLPFAPPLIVKKN